VELTEFVKVVQSVPAETSLALPGIADARETWIQEIRSARVSIEIGQMYLSHKPGEALEGVFEALEDAGKRGVKIRLVLSKNMMNNDPAALARFRAIVGAEVRVLDLSEITKGILHAKYFVFDRKRTFIGSQNFDWKSLTQIFETGVLVDDVGFASQVFAVWSADWRMAGGEKPQALPVQPVGLKGVELVAAPDALNPPHIASALDGVLTLIQSARKSITVQLLNYSTYSSKDGMWLVVDDALRAAAKRGVKIRLLMSDWNMEKPGINSLKELQKVPNITVKMATIPQHSSGYISYARVIHSKVMVVDDEILWLGTSNWSRGYFLATRGLEVIVRDSKFAALGAKVFSSVWESKYAEVVDPNREYSPPKKD
jgi:phosphatidylserine/phosphatidylglycerophosphate/cardiolipin synthase-like enzyme